MRKRIMILGASILQLPAILKAKELGLEVIAVDINENAVGFEYSDIHLNISTLDSSKVLEAAIKHGIDGIITLASDLPMRTVAYVAKELNLVGISEETARKATNKGLMRECLKENNIPIPKFERVHNYNKYLEKTKKFTNSFIVKPADNSGSRGIFLVKNIWDQNLIENAFNYSIKHSRTGEIVIEEFMEGPEVSVETISFNGKTEVIAITDKLTTGAPHFIEMGHSQPSTLTYDIQNEIIRITKKAIKAIGIHNGPSHTEIIVTNEGPKIVEIGARLGGDNITSHLVPLSTGIDIVKHCIQVAMNEIPELETRTNRGSAIRYFYTQPGIINTIEGVHEVNRLVNIKEIYFSKNIGDSVHEINNSVDRIGYVIAQGNDQNEAVTVCEKAVKQIKIEIK